MQLFTSFHLLAVAAMSLLLLPVPATAQLDYYAKKAGMKYFGAATDSPGQRERAGLQAAYAKYDAILLDPKEFGQTTPTNGMKVWISYVFPLSSFLLYLFSDLPTCR